MKIQTPPLRTTIAALSGSILAVMALSGCAGGGAAYRSGPMPSAGVYVDDYDYFPGYETYYSRSRHEYYYREGSTWVSRPQPRGVSAEKLNAAPSVRMDFHDDPAKHHQTVVKSYPKDWKAPAKTPQARPEHQDDKGQSADRKDNRPDDPK